MYALDNKLCEDDGTVVAEFSSHWAACAAMIRRHDPGFRSIGGDKLEDLEIERQKVKPHVGNVIQRPSVVG